ncbi:MAG: DEAD/DEAH box helicase [Pseudomonadales bacterium]
MKFLKNLFVGTPKESPATTTTETTTTEKPRKASKKPNKKQKPVVRSTGDFAKLELPEDLDRAIGELGFSNCTPVQKEVLPHSLDGKDIIAQAQTGTGKTAAFLISVITYHLENPELEKRAPGAPFALVIAPTRELVMQITSDAENLSKFCDFRSMAVVGGIDYEKQKTQLRKPVDLVIATPGRLLDFIRSNVIDLSGVETLVIDEADRMLSMGFIPDVKDIIRRTPRKENRQTQLFSATFSYDIKRLAEQWTLDPVRIEIEPEQVAVDSVTQEVYLTSSDQKITVLYNLARKPEVNKMMVFVNRRDETRELESQLYRHGIDCGLLTGEVPQKKRIKTLDQFKSGEIKVLVATDVAGRGIHVDDVTHVVNYNLPEDPEDYVHRIGRTGRAGATGVSISLACEDDSFMLPNIEELLGEPLNKGQPPEDLLEPLPTPVRQRRPKPASKPPRDGRGRGPRRGR